MSRSECRQNPPRTLPTITDGDDGRLPGGENAGFVAEIGGLRSYVNGPPDSKLAVILVSDLFGYEAPKLRKIADKFAECGYRVVVPDFFAGDYYNLNNPERPIPVWIQCHDPAKGWEDAKPVIAALRERGVSSIGAAGFCWGAKVVIDLGKSDQNIQAGVLLHPARVTIDDIKDVRAPTAILGAEHDKVSPPELLKQFKDVLSTKPEVDAYVKIFPGVVHGWSVRYEDDDEVAVKGAQEAQRDMLAWFSKHLK